MFIKLLINKKKQYPLKQWQLTVIESLVPGIILISSLQPTKQILLQLSIFSQKGNLTLKRQND